MAQNSTTPLAAIPTIGLFGQMTQRSAANPPASAERDRNLARSAKHGAAVSLKVA